MQVGLFFLRARRIRNLLRTMTREAGRVPAPRTPLSKIFRRAAAREIISLGPHCRRAFIFLVSQRLRPRKGVDTAIPSCYFSTAEKFFALTPRTEARQTGTMAFVAKKIFLTKGVGKHRERLSSFELALRNAGIAACNIVRVSSIFPPNCKLISRSEGLKHMKPGQVAFTVISENSTKEAHRLIAASIGLALPSDKTMYGYLSEHHSFGETEEVAGEYAEELAAEMLATTLNVEFDPDLSFDEKKEVYRISNKIVRTMNITQSAVGDKRGLWTTVLGAAILIGEDD